jgi:signal peptidase I
LFARKKLAEKETAKKAEKKKETLPESITGIAAVLVSGLFIITFVLQAFEIPSGSMENTLLVGDHVFVDRLTPTLKAGYTGPVMAYRQIRHGDVIVFLHPDPAQQGTYVVKRIMGVPGDRIHLRNGVVYRNGEALNEPYVLPKQNYDPFRDEFPKYPPPVVSDVSPEQIAEWTSVLRENIQGEDLVVPKNSYFGMGDHRENSLDSRYWGLIPRENIIGRPLFIYWSFETPEYQYKKTLMTDRVSFVGHVILHFFDETRWRRMFHLIR